MGDCGGEENKGMGCLSPRLTNRDFNGLSPLVGANGKINGPDLDLSN